MDEILEIRQYKSRFVNRIQPWSSEGWHKTDVQFDFCVQLKLGSSMWSQCNIDINEVGTSTIVLPPPDGSVKVEPIVLHVEVRIAEPAELCSVLVVVQRARVDGSSALTVCNESDSTVCIIQSGIDLTADAVRGLEVTCSVFGHIGIFLSFILYCR
jgi:hypothetical protein